MPDPSTLSGLITYLLYLIPIAVAIWVGWVQMEVQVKVQKDLFKSQQLVNPRIELLDHLNELHNRLIRLTIVPADEADLAMEKLSEASRVTSKIQNTFRKIEIYLPATFCKQFNVDHEFLESNLLNALEQALDKKRLQRNFYRSIIDSLSNMQELRTQVLSMPIH